VIEDSPARIVLVCRKQKQTRAVQAHYEIDARIAEVAHPVKDNDGPIGQIGNHGNPNP